MRELARGAPAPSSASNAALRLAHDAALEGSRDKSSFSIFTSATVDLAERVADLVERVVYPEVQRRCEARGELSFCADARPVAMEDAATLNGEAQLLRLKTLFASRPFAAFFIGRQYGTPIDRFHPEVTDAFPFAGMYPSVSLVDLELVAACQDLDAQGRGSSVVYLIGGGGGGGDEKRKKEEEEGGATISEGQRALMERMRERVASGPLRCVHVDTLELAIEDLMRTLPDAILDEFPASTLLWRESHIRVSAAAQVALVEDQGPNFLPWGRTLEIVTGFIDGREEAFAELEASPPDQQGQDDDDPSSSARKAFADYSPITEEDQGDELAMGRKPLVIASEVDSCGGVTSTLAHWLWRAELHRERPVSHFVFFHFASASPHSASLAAVAHRLVSELNEFLKVDEPAPYDLASLSRDLPARLAQIERTGSRALIVIDGLHGLLERDMALAWLPKRFPPCVRCVLSVGTASELVAASQQRGWLLTLAPVVGGAAVGDFMLSACERAGCALPQEELSNVRRALREVPTRCTPAFMTTIAALLAAANPGNDPGLTRMVLDSLLQVEDVRSLYAVLLDRLAVRAASWGKSLLGDALALLRLSAHGLSATELIHILGVSRTSFASLFHGFDGVFFQRVGASSDRDAQRLNLRTDALRDVVAERFLSNPEELSRVRHVLIAHFGGFVTAIRYPSVESIVHCGADGEFARGCGELCWGFLNGVDREDVIETLADPSVFRALWSSDLRRDLFRTWQGAAQVGDDAFNAGKRYEDRVMDTYWDSMNSDGSIDDVIRPVIADLLVDMADLCMALYNEHAGRLLDLAVEIEEKALVAAAAGEGDDSNIHASTSSVQSSTAVANNVASEHLASLHNRLGVFYRTAGRPEDALEHFYEAFTMRQRVLGSSEATASSIVDCAEILLEGGSEADAAAAFSQGAAICTEAGITEFSTVYARLLNNMGLLAKREGQLGKAETMYRQSLEIRREGGAVVHPQTGVTLRNLGSLLFGLERYSEAKKVFKEALDIALKVHGALHLATAVCHEWLGDTLDGLQDPEAAVHRAMAERIREKIDRLREQAIQSARR